MTDLLTKAFLRVQALADEAGIRARVSLLEALGVNADNLKITPKSSLCLPMEWRRTLETAFNGDVPDFVIFSSFIPKGRVYVAEDPFGCFPDVPATGGVK